MEDKEKVLNAFKSFKEPVGAKDIAEKTGIPKDKVSKIISKLKKEDLIHSPIRCKYQIKK